MGGKIQDLSIRKPSEHTAYALCVVQSVLGRLFGFLRADVLDGHLDGLSTFLNEAFGIHRIVRLRLFDHGSEIRE